ncbi:MAG TPA: DUF58 domain-containing protein [Candidatus Acidoferrales bacterium]|jgi:uncharacterized protein (DUF58 family)|nr:DUF58 domain-containing protein [Candidatus Acidoferrales bacterium]
MSSAATFIPPFAAARARSQGRWRVSFGTRFFLALLIGLVWVVPAAWSPRLIAGMFAWDAVFFFLWLQDLLRLPKPAELELRRVWTSPPSLGVRSKVSVELHNFGRRLVFARVTDETPQSLRENPPVLELTAPSGISTRGEYQILPSRRGDLPLGKLYVRYHSALRLAERWAVADAPQTVRVLPNLEQARQQTLYLIRTRQVAMERRRRRVRGLGREFESLRDYRTGDEFRNISWTATARRSKLITRVFQVERSQTVWIVIDSGRLLRERILSGAGALPLSKLDYAVNAALALAQVAMHSGDRVGLLAYGREIQQNRNAGRGAAHLHSIAESLALVRAEPYEADHGRAAQALLSEQHRRSLIVWITDLAETAGTPDVVEYALQMTRRHLVLFAALAQPDLNERAAQTPESEEDMFRYVAAIEIMQRRELLLRRLRQQGVLAMELIPGSLTAALVNQYLAIKDRSLI